LGYAKCKWNEEKGTTNAGNVVTNRGYESYIKENFDLLKNFDEKHVELAAGQHKYKISYAFSSLLPTSFKCSYGSIKYKICVTVDRPWKLRSNYEFPFTIIRPLNLNSQSSLKTPMKEELFKKFRMDFTSDPLLMSVSIPFQGYVPGQTITCQVNVENKSQTHVKEVKISLKKIVILNSTKPTRKTKHLVIAEAKVSTDAVGVQKTQIFEKKLVVPSLPPNILNSDVIQVSYELRAKAKTSGFSRSPKLKLPITIGTSPLVGIPNSPSCRNLREFLIFRKCQCY
jgi:Arrestin (or S-antigen), C-terminal domain/Arrestin (or S-antigen), N-terminal domain